MSASSTVVETLEGRGVLVAFMEPLLRAEGVYVAIGEEQPLEHLRECSAVLSTYGRADDLLGVVGVIGPTRLPYWRAVPMVSTSPPCSIACSRTRSWRVRVLGCNSAGWSVCDWQPAP